MVDIIKKPSHLSGICRNKYITYEDKQCNTSLVLCTCIILLFSFVIYDNLGSFPIVEIATFHTDIVTHTSNTFSLGLMACQLNIPKISKKDVW